LLLEQARSGDRQALDRLLRENYGRIFAVCRRLTGNEADAADAAQEAMISVVKGLSRFDGRSQFGTWVYRIAVNASIDELRRRSRRPITGLDGIEPRPAPEGFDASVTGVDVDVALMKLPLEFRAPVVLRDLCGLDYAEIAEVLRIPGGTVRSRIARGRSALVDLLDPAKSES
jgi:RNA polymerase sigma-70 factor (ECF subfamily)